MPIRRRQMLTPLLAWAALPAFGAAAQTRPTPPAEREPNPDAVRARERAAGVAPGAATERREGQAEDQIYRQLMGQNPNAPASGSAPGPAASPAQDARREDQIYRELMGQNPAAAPASR